MGGTRILDSLRSAIAAANPFSAYQQQPIMTSAFAPQLALAAYLSSGMLRKTIDIPASDRVREWREWQAESDQVTKLEAEEKRLGLIRKVREAEMMRGLGGGALILALPGNLNQPAGRGRIEAVNIVSRWQLSLVDIDTNMASPRYGEPAMFRINAGATGQQDIHPSRVIAFRGDPVPMGFGTTTDDAFWGASRLQRIVGEVQKADNAAQWFSELVKKAKLLRVGIANLTDYNSTQAGRDALAARIALIATGESTLNATVFNAGNGKDNPAESITDYQVTWAGIPAMMDAFDQRVAAVADIPFTRLMGRSPAGMNATGEHDAANWAAAVAAGQELELRPCLEQLDAFLFASAGVDPKDVWWQFRPLYKPTAKEEAERFKTYTEGFERLEKVSALPSAAFNAGVQSVIEANGWMPGASAILADMSEDERFGITPDDDGTDPSSLQAKGGDRTVSAGAGGDDDGSGLPARRAANDAKPMPLYVHRKLLNAAELVEWAKAQGFKTTLPAADMHVTVLYSRTPVDPIKLGNGWSSDKDGNLTVQRGGPRAVEKLGESAVVLLFASDDLSWRHRGMVENGASHDFDEYQPHVTLTYDAGDVDLDAIKPFTGALRFGPEVFERLNEDWKSGVTEV